MSVDKHKMINKMEKEKASWYYGKTLKSWKPFEVYLKKLPTFTRNWHSAFHSEKLHCYVGFH